MFDDEALQFWYFFLIRILIFITLQPKCEFGFFYVQLIRI